MEHALLDLLAIFGHCLKLIFCHFPWFCITLLKYKFSSFWFFKFPNADPLVCGFTLLSSVPVLFFGFFSADYSLPVCYALTFFAGKVCAHQEISQIFVLNDIRILRGFLFSPIILCENCSRTYTWGWYLVKPLAGISKTLVLGGWRPLSWTKSCLLLRLA